MTFLQKSLIAHALTLTLFSSGVFCADQMSVKPSSAADAQGVTIDMKSVGKLKNALQQKGWKVEKKENGDLLIFPRPSLDSGTVPIFVDNPAQPAHGDAATSKTDDVVDQSDLDRLEKKMRATGWTVKRNAAGDLLLFTGSSVKPEKNGTRATGTVSAPEASEQDISIDRTDLERLEKTIRKKGWTVKRNDQGDLLLYPPITSSVKKQASVPAVSVDDCFGESSSVAVLTGEFTLPLKTVADARKVALSWVRQKKHAQKISVGKIRRVNGLYVVSIVSQKAPYQLQSQLIISRKNGKTVLFP